MTNFEKIKSMTVEELAWFLCRSVIPEDADEHMHLSGMGQALYQDDVVELLNAEARED